MDWPKVPASVKMTAFLLFLGGAAIGWLVGLSASPVVATVLSPLLAVLIAVTSVVAGLRTDQAPAAEGQPPRKKHRFRKATLVSVCPAVFLSLGIAAGATFGMVVRTRDWLSPSPSDLIARWDNLGLDKVYIAKHFLNRLEPLGGETDPSKKKDGDDEAKGEKPEPPPPGPTGTSTHASVMWTGGKIDHCKYMLNEMEHLDLASLRREVDALGTPFPGELGHAINDEATLRKVIRIICENAAVAPRK